ncbi:hypothetical protein HLH34_04270 [Gluconacetobacter azotocaptans]|uniref:Uncharacterized protein n=1 Tax=Gluconacetobacter azotocaptans TaxID=142834 RepID=A0A7W4PE89_9PROT|nr:hypothetical protein [Gluconacetobacter azotocaptans]MBB2189179.1 hypothetical protein [Gluconacetobacter azotocaptans]GBQ32162.1 hypothetical protein AA13594_2288 [Gluconacetobacter azotocaptans DSM 13594]
MAEDEITPLPAPQEPAWGAIGADFPLWQAKEAMAQIEKRIATQTTTLGVYETRATTLLGWLSAEVIATVTATLSRLVSTAPGNLSAAAVVAMALSVLIPAATSAFLLTRVFTPKDWSAGGADIGWLVASDMTEPSELEVLQAFAQAGAVGVTTNDAALHAAFRSLTLGWRWFLAVPMSALVVSLFVLAAVR